jgi:hypothetical protein
MAETPESVNVETVREEVDAQVAPAREPDTSKVQIHEVKVSTDVVITDPNDPLAVQVPETDDSFLALPAHKLDGPSPEQQFAGADAPEEVDADEEYETGSTRPATEQEKSSS